MVNNSLSVDEAMAKAKQLVRQGDSSAAAELYQQIVTQNPQNKKAGKALKNLQKKSQPSARMANLQADMNKLMQLYTSDMHDQAYTHAAHLAQIYPEQPVPFNIMGVIQTNRGKNLEAIECFEQSLAIDSTYVDALSNLGSVLTKELEYDKAIACLQRAIQLQPKDADGYFHLGNTLLKAGRQEEAILSYEKAIDIRPLHSPSHNQLGRAFEAADNMNQALASYRNALDLDPQLVEAYTNIGLIFQSRGQYDMAIAWFHDALKRRPNEGLASRSLARVLLQSGKKQDAIAAYKKYLAMNPTDNEALHFLHAAEKNTTDMPPSGYVEKLFDDYAPRFERHLSGSLGYRGPEILRSLVASSGDGENIAANAIDLGCGTGLAGDAFKDICGTLVGVDLSNNMLGQARKKGIYKQLLNADITEAIEKLNQVFDLFICADTLIYIGDLKPLFESIGGHSKSGTLFTFSTELDRAEDFELLPSGRYCHSDDYVKETAAAAGFDLVKFEEQPLRKESRQWINGGYYLFKYL